MKSFNILVFFYVFIFIIKISYQSSYIILPFKTSTKEKKVYPDNLLQNDVEVTLNIGTPPQSIDLNLRSKAYTFFISSIDTNLPYTTFNYSNSKSLIKVTKNPESFGGQEYSKGIMIYESLIINGKEIKNVSLIMATDLNYKESGALGLRLVESHEVGNDLSFIYQLKNLYGLETYSYIIDYKNDNEGELIIGVYPHIYNPNKFNKNNFYYTKAGSIGKNVDWILNFDVLKYGNKTITTNYIKGFTQIEYGLIQAPKDMKNKFEQLFFNGKCTPRFNIFKSITIIHCNENINISEFKNVSFILKDISVEFILTYEDLFIKQGNEYIFGIVFDEKSDSKESAWILGKIFMKKYELIYDLDRKIIGTYKGHYIEPESEPEKNTTNIVLIVISCILGAILIGLVIFIFYYVKRKRKSRANELKDEDAEYFPTE